MAFKQETFLTSVHYCPCGPTPGHSWPPTRSSKGDRTRCAGGNAGTTPAHCLGSQPIWPPARSSHATSGGWTLHQWGWGRERIEHQYVHLNTVEILRRVYRGPSLWWSATRRQQRSVHSQDIQIVSLWAHLNVVWGWTCMILNLKWLVLYWWNSTAQLPEIPAGSLQTSVCLWCKHNNQRWL